MGSIVLSSVSMAPMKAMKAVKSLTKGAIAEALADDSGPKKSECMKIMDILASVATKQVKSAGKFVIPGVCMIKTKKKAATKAGKRIMFGKEVKVKAKPAKTVVKAFAVAALKAAI